MSAGGYLFALGGTNERLGGINEHRGVWMSTGMCRGKFFKCTTFSSIFFLHNNNFVTIFHPKYRGYLWDRGE